MLSLDVHSIASLLKHQLPELQGIYLFGSFASDPAYITEKSDVDLAVLCKKRLSPPLKSQLIDQLSELVNRDIDFIEFRYVDTIFQEEILKTAKKIAVIDNMACELFEDYVYCSALDFREWRLPHIKEIIARGSVYG